MDEQVADFASITGADPARAQQYLTLTEGNLEQAIQLYFDSDGADMGASMPHESSAQPQATGGTNPSQAINIDSDDDDVVYGGGSGTGTGSGTPAGVPRGAAYEDDEAMARRLQEEAYGQAGGEDEVRAPMARRTEALVGPDADPYYGHGAAGGEDGMQAAVMEQLMNRQRRAGAGSSRAGIFNQRQDASIWTSEDPDAQRRNLSRATGGASDQSSKSNLLAQLFSPPVDIIYPGLWTDARDTGREEEKWLMVNVQDPSIFDCQVLNRDLWKNKEIKETIQENFLFLQYNKDDPKGAQYVNYYFHARDSDDAYPHIAIVDPRTGEQVKVWSGSPVPSPTDFLMDLHEFLDRYSLKAFAKNPVATRKPEQKAKDVERMTEEEMLEMAMQNSLANARDPIKDTDPDALTKAHDANGKGKGKAVDLDSMDVDVADTGIPVSNGNTEPAEASASLSPFARISATKPHEEPPSDPATSTRIQFRYSGGRQIRRFALSDPVERLYEWLKASPLEGKEGVDFELKCMGKDLIESLHETIEEAGLKNGTVMVEFLESES